MVNDMEVKMKSEGRQDKEIATPKVGEMFVLKASVPLKDGAFLKDWNDTCQAAPPLGFGDYRWGKMLYDHLFVKNFAQHLDSLTSQVKTLTAEIHTLREELKKKEQTDGTFH